MSKMIPQATADVMRKFVTFAVDTYGIDCTLYIPSNLTTIETNDIYVKPSDYTFTSYTTKVYIDWTGNKYRLRKLGLYVENDLPMVCWFSYVALRDITVHSYFTISMQYVPNSIADTDKFEIVDVLIPGMHDKAITQFFRFAPLRIKT